MSTQQPGHCGSGTEVAARTLVERLRCLAIGQDDPAITEAADAIERMQTWLEDDCRCPCCLESCECLDLCTFAADCPEEAERMAGAREALFGA